jgi:hypothetical protein
MVAGALGVGGVGAMAGGADEPAHLAPHSVRRAASSALPLATASVSASTPGSGAGAAPFIMANRVALKSLVAKLRDARAASSP